MRFKHLIFPLGDGNSVAARAASGDSAELTVTVLVS